MQATACRCLTTKPASPRLPPAPAAKTHHPGWEVRYWDDRSVAALIRSDYPWFMPTFKSYKQVVQRSDAARWLILYKYGGVYIDNGGARARTSATVLLPACARVVGACPRCRRPPAACCAREPLFSCTKSPRPRHTAGHASPCSCAQMFAKYLRPRRKRCLPARRRRVLPLHGAQPAGAGPGSQLRALLAARQGGAQLHAHTRPASAPGAVRSTTCCNLPAAACACTQAHLRGCTAAAGPQVGNAVIASAAGHPLWPLIIKEGIKR